MTETTVNAELLGELVRPLLGMAVSRPWLGYGSAAFLEVGKLTRLPMPDGTGSDQGEVTICIEWDWRVERDTVIVGGSSQRRPRIVSLLSDLNGLLIEDIIIDGRPPELNVQFNNGFRLRSMAMVPDDPQWTIRLDSDRWLYCTRGLIRCGDGSGQPDSLTEDEKWVAEHAKATADRWNRSLVTPGPGKCRDCLFFVGIDGDFHFLDYGVCTNPASALDGRATKTVAGCQAFAPFSRE